RKLSLAGTQALDPTEKEAAVETDCASMLPLVFVIAVPVVTDRVPMHARPTLRSIAAIPTCQLPTWYAAAPKARSETPSESPGPSPSPMAVPSRPATAQPLVNVAATLPQMDPKALGSDRHIPTQATSRSSPAPTSNAWPPSNFPVRGAPNPMVLSSTPLLIGPGSP